MSMTIPTSETIRTKRCRLRYVSEDDIPHVWSASRVAGFNDGMRWDPPKEIEELYEPLRRNQEAWVKGMCYTWTIEKRDTGDFLGRIDIRQEPAHGTWSIGFWIYPEQQGNGYATEAAKALIDFGFSRLKARVISAAHAKWNVSSRRVMEKVGMRLVGENPCGFKKSGKCVEEFEYEIKVNDWRKEERGRA